ncbi:hypothetical protein [Peribacillus sp. NPDC096540]|uniref:hypothetical protein n=1 Tax=Peribacillus sp. NPDC096540 TaxID=3390612 RepID=UPI003D06071D
MIKIYTENNDRSLLISANKELNEYLNFYFHFYDEINEEYIIEDIFPEHLYKFNKDRCVQVVNELRMYVRDHSEHELTPTHEYALFKVLNCIRDLEEEDDIEVLEDSRGINFYMNNCFQDFDFDDIEIFFETYFKDPLFEKKFNINLEEYFELVTEDIVQKYIRTKEVYLVFKSMMKDKVSLEKQDGDVFNNIQSNVQGNEVFIGDTSLTIEEGDRITRILSNGHKEVFIVLNSNFYEKKLGIPAHYELKVRKENAIEHERFQSQIYNDYSTNTINGGENSRINRHSTDNSTNTSIKVTDITIFNQLRDAIAESNLSATEKDKLIIEVNGLEQSVGTPNYPSRYQKFIASAANHMTMIAPFIPQLTSLLGNL